MKADVLSVFFFVPIWAQIYVYVYVHVLRAGFTLFRSITATIIRQTAENIKKEVAGIAVTIASSYLLYFLSVPSNKFIP